MKKITSDFILDFRNNDYPYLEEINEGILKQIAIIGEGACILDVGAGRGALGEALHAMGYYVCAIESNTHAAMEASSRVDQVICADLLNLEEINNLLNRKKFKYIIFSDVLEHFFDPLQVLHSYLPLLAEDGELLVSVPNAVNWLNRIKIMLGLFHYEMSGVMDRTHIRFFTYRSAKQLMRASGCILERVDSTPFLMRAFLPMIKALLNKTNSPIEAYSNSKNIIESPLYQFYKKYVYPLEYCVHRILPSLFAFRIILVARKR